MRSKGVQTFAHAYIMTPTNHKSGDFTPLHACCFIDTVPECISDPAEKLSGPGGHKWSITAVTLLWSTVTSFKPKCYFPTTQAGPAVLLRTWE